MSPFIDGDRFEAPGKLLPIGKQLQEVTEYQRPGMASIRLSGYGRQRLGR